MHNMVHALPDQPDTITRLDSSRVDTSAKMSSGQTSDGSGMI